MTVFEIEAFWHALGLVKHPEYRLEPLEGPLVGGVIEIGPLGQGHDPFPVSVRISQTLPDMVKERRIIRGWLADLGQSNVQFG